MAPSSVSKIIVCLAAVSSAFTQPQTRAFSPKVVSTEELGIVSDASLNRDSCGSVRIGDRALWTCRDTQSSRIDLPIWSSSAAWTNFNQFGTPQTSMYSPKSQQPYFKPLSNECPNNSAGVCSDNSRWVIWPDSPPLVTKKQGSVVTAYSWIKRAHLKPDGSAYENDPRVSLYKFVYDTNQRDRNTVPNMVIQNEEFWPTNSIPYGVYGNAVKDGYVYLWGQPSNKKVALARVRVDDVENSSKYEFYQCGTWKSYRPTLDNGCVDVPHASAGGQGTFFFSAHWDRWVWIGQSGFEIVADFFITTSPGVEGPWDEPQLFYKGQTGTAPLPDYSLQAHPGLSYSGYMDSNSTFISYTKQDKGGKYSTPLVRVNFDI